MLHSSSAPLGGGGERLEVDASKCVVVSDGAAYVDGVKIGPREPALRSAGQTRIADPATVQYDQERRCGWPRVLSDGLSMFAGVRSGCYLVHRERAKSTGEVSDVQAVKQVSRVEPNYVRYFDDCLLQPAALNKHNVQKLG